PSRCTCASRRSRATALPSTCRCTAWASTTCACACSCGSGTRLEHWVSTPRRKTHDLGFHCFSVRLERTGRGGLRSRTVELDSGEEQRRVRPGLSSVCYPHARFQTPAKNRSGSAG